MDGPHHRHSTCILTYSILTPLDYESTRRIPIFTPMKIEHLMILMAIAMMSHLNLLNKTINVTSQNDTLYPATETSFAGLYEMLQALLYICSLFILLALCTDILSVFRVTTPLCGTDESDLRSLSSSLESLSVDEQCNQPMLVVIENDISQPGFGLLTEVLFECEDTKDLIRICHSIEEQQGNADTSPESNYSLNHTQKDSKE